MGDEETIELLVEPPNNYKNKTINFKMQVIKIDLLAIYKI